MNEEKKPREFSFDHALWSHDGFKDDENGYSHPAPGSQYADQKKVMALLGDAVLEKAWQGLNSTLFAYGQTGAGKSYSIFGYGQNKGIIPNVSEELFRRIGEGEGGGTTFQVTVQMVEIYMEKIQDLLVPPLKRGPPLQIKQIKSSISIPDAVKTPVTSYEAIERVIATGDSNRTIGET